MIKYANIENYIYAGEVLPHVYQWRENIKILPTLILINAYTGEPKIFKGKVFNLDKTYTPVKINENELKEVEDIIGSPKVYTDFNEFMKVIDVNTDFGIYRLKESE